MAMTKQTSGMAPFAGTFDEANADAQCLSEYYPSPDQVAENLVSSKTYGAFLVYDGDWNNGWAAKSWKSFNSFIGQPEAFIAQQAENSSDFWQNLSAVISALEAVECIDRTSTTPQPTTTTIATTASLPPITEMTTTTMPSTTEITRRLSHPLLR